MSVSGGKFKALEMGNELKCESIQVFIRNVRGWTSKLLDEEEITQFLEKRKEISNIWPIITHNSYLINLASIEQEKLDKSYLAMLDELRKADQLKIEYANMHPGNKNEDEADEPALSRITIQLNKLIEATKDSKVIILLETTAGQGNDVGYKFEHMKYIIDKVKDKNRIGVCFDTAHSFAAGYDFTTKKKYECMLDTFNEIIGLKYLYAFHLNDSQKGLGSKVDRHTHIGQGKIGKVPFGFFINDDRFTNHPGILETPKGNDMKEDIMNIAILKSLREK